MMSDEQRLNKLESFIDKLDVKLDEKMEDGMRSGLWILLHDQPLKFPWRS